MNKQRNIIVLFLGIITTLALVLLFYTQSLLNNQKRTNVSLAFSASQTIESIEFTSEANSTARSISESTFEANLNSAKIAQATAEAELSKASASQKELFAKYSDALAKLGDAQKDAKEIGASIVCDRAPASIDYSSNANASASIKKWLEETEGKIDDASWKVIWNNSKASIHEFRGKYLYLYILYFNEPNLSYKNAVFNVNQMCWLDR